MKKILFILVLLFNFNQANATHIVGGEITYSHLVGNTYEISLTVYRDDYFAGAPFDQPATLHLYSEAGTYVDSYAFDLSNSSTANNYLVNPYPNPCLEIPTDASGNPQILIQKGIYTDNITVPNGNTGYYIMYGRCCRNGALINNLTNPGDQGSMYKAFIPPTTMYANNSPTFNNVPPIFLCQNSPFSLDQSATDPDGDSLYYRMCSPLQALTSGNPAVGQFATPPPGFGPPFDPVVWSAPFDEFDPLGGIPLTIGQNTGFITGTPNTVGSFVVGICVEEWRNGVLMGEVLRDFQYAVSNCDNIPFPIIPTTPQDDLGIQVDLPLGVNGIYALNCESNTINFDNNSLLPGNVNSTAVNASYHWDFGDGNTSTDFEPTHTYADTGIYTVALAVIIDDGGLLCSDTSKFLVFIYPVFNPDFTVERMDSICRVDSANFIDITTSAIYDNPIEWNWIFGDGTPNSTEQNPSHLYSLPGDYQVILFARSSKGCTRLDTGTVTIRHMPNSVINMSNPICAGDTANFNANSSNIAVGSVDSVFWDLNLGVTSSELDTINYFPTSGTYPIQLTVFSNYGCADTENQNLIVNALPITTTSGNDTICPNTNLQLNATGGVTYTWTPAGFLNNPSIPNPTLQSPTIDQYYYVEVTNANNCVSIDSLFVGLKPPPPANAGEDTSVCLNLANMVSFNTTVSLNATGGIAYSWTPAAGLSAINIPDPDASPSTTTDYIVTVSDVHGCQANDTVKVVVLNPALELIQVTTDSLCLGDTVVVDVLDQGDISSYAWSPTTFLTNPIANEPGFFPIVNTLYELTVQNYCYQDKDSVLIEVIPTPNLDAGPLDSVCMDDTNYQLSATPTDLEIYQWTSTDNSISDPTIFNPTIMPSITSTYFLVGTDSVGTLACVSTDNVTILVNDNPTLDIQFPIDYFGFICQGDSITLTASSNNAIDFDWDADNSLTSINTQVTEAFPQDTTKYFVTVTNGHDCTTRDSIIVNVQKPIVGSIIGDSIMCEGFYVDLEGEGGLYYNWYPSEANFTNSNYSITQAHLDTSMNVFLVISNDCFNDTSTKFINVNQLPVVDAGLDFRIIRDDVSGFLDGSGDGKPLWYTDALNFTGILNSPAQYGPEVQPLVTTNYVLEIENPVTGCKNYDTMTLFVDVVTLLAFPTGFSPNGDGTNDFARIIKYLNIETLEDFSIYNRYGEKVFTTSEFNAAWDGTYKGVEQEAGVYTFLIRAVTKDKESILKKGNITLIR